MSSRRSIVLAASTVVVGACAWVDHEPAVHVIPDPAGQRAATLLDAADTAMAHGRPEIAYTAMTSAFDQATPSPEIAYRIARMADRLDDVGTEARAYRRYLALTPDGPTADTVRTRLLALIAGPMRLHLASAPGGLPDVVTVAERVSAAGEVEPTPKPTAKTQLSAKHRRSKHRR